jgi:pimeloyl-ACP methyl ester carboxylesterase
VALLTLPDGRTLSYDDVGQPDGAPVIYLHGTPDSRLARHPDDGLALAAGVRLIAVDRPGYGDTSALAPGRPAYDMADELAALLDHLDLRTATLLAWSGGALAGLAAADEPKVAERLRALHVVAGVVPRQAFDDAGVRAAGAHRLGLIDMAESLPADSLAEIAAPMLAPYPCDLALALEHEQMVRDPAEQAALGAVPGAVDRLAESLVEAVRHGLAGVQADVEAQIRPYDIDLGDVAVPVRLWYGTTDTTTPPAFGHWYTSQLPASHLELVDGAGHYLPFTHWPQLLTALRT